MKKRSILLLVVFLMTPMLVGAQNAAKLYTHKVGEYELILLQEAQQTSEPGILYNATGEMIKETMPDGTFQSAVNAFLVKTPDVNILIDTGFGRKLFDNLSLAGVQPEDISYVYLTHMHGDHIGGLLRDGKVAFPNATLCVSRQEVDYWTSEEAMSSVPENRRGGFVAAQNVIAAYKQNAKFELLEPEILGQGVYNARHSSAKKPEGIVPYQAFGHTPGHTMYMIYSEDEKLLVWADLTHVIPIQMAYPEVSVVYDVDPEMAAKARKGVLEVVAGYEIPVAGMHVAYPGMGWIEKEGKGYRFVPLNRVMYKSE